MSESKSTNSLGCAAQFALSVGIIGAVAAAWFWSQGSDPRAAVANGLVLGAQVTGGGCLCIAAFFVGLVVLAVVAQR